MIWRLTCMLNDCGRLTSFIPTSSGVALPLRLLQRLQQARAWTEDQLRQREQWLEPLTKKRSRSDFVVNNEGSPDRLRPQVVDILEKVVSQYADRR